MTTRLRQTRLGIKILDLNNLNHDFMELEMYLNGKFIDSVSVSSSQLGKIHELQHQLEKKYCHELEYADDQPQFFITGIPSGMDEYNRNKLTQGLT